MRRKRIRPLRLCLLIMLIALALTLLTLAAISLYPRLSAAFAGSDATTAGTVGAGTDSSPPASTTAPSTAPPTTTQPTTRSPVNPAFDRSTLHSKHVLLLRLSDGAALLDIGGNKKMPPASMTKIMTAIVAIELLPDVSAEVRLGEAMFEGIYESSASVAGFEENERVRAIDLLYGVLLPSGAECAIGLAEYIADSEADFVKLMNEKAKALDMDGTHFENVTGLHDADHYSTAADMATLLRYAVKNPQFYDILTSARHSSGATNLHPDGITYYSTLFSNLKSFEEQAAASILGGKTGYTSEAGQCLASLADVGGERYILVTAGAYGDPKEQQLHIEDAVNIYQNYLLG